MKIKYFYKMKRLFTIIIILLVSGYVTRAQNDDFNEIHIDKTPQHIQPMTGIVFWQGQHQSSVKDVTSLEFSYMLFNDVVNEEEDVYDWTVVDDKLDDIASRGHQAVFRFRYVYVGEETSVPDYIKNLPDYNETEGTSEGQTTWFPDWTNQELQDFTLEFYTHFAQRYDNDPRLAFLEVGFGLWGEYHIYDGPFELGVTFPSIEFQEAFFRHLDTTFTQTPFMISIDAASIDTDPPYTPFYSHPDLLEIPFGLFDDSFMHEEFGNPDDYNTESWNFFDRNRYKIAPAGGEFSYYTQYDQQHVLDYPNGPYGKPFEYFANEFHITFIIGNDQALYQTPERIEQAGRASGYLFKIISFLSKTDSSLVAVKNVGVAPFYYDAYVTVNGVRSDVSLKLLAPGDSVLCPVAAGGNDPVLTIESDRLVDGQEIEYLGTENNLGINVQHESRKFTVYPNPVNRNELMNLKTESKKLLRFHVYNLNGEEVLSGSFRNNAYIDTHNFKKGMYIITVSDGKAISSGKVVIQ